MKIKFISTIVIGFALLISSCDFVSIPAQGTVGPTGPTGVVDSTVHRKVLLEDYTGHKCTACPAAAITANSIVLANPEKVIVIGVHAGFFANAMTTGTQYLTDFKTAAGTAYDTYFGISAVANPNGLINRKDYTSSTTNHIKSPGTWATEVAIELAKPPLAKLEIVNSYNSGTRVLTCNVNSTFLQDTLTGGPYKLIVSVLQDSIIADQLDAGVYVPAYVHRHVLRDNINGTWGDNLVNAGSIITNSVINKNYNYTFPTTYPAAGGASSTSCDVNHCYIVAYIYNDVTKEVIQVEEKKIQ